MITGQEVNKRENEISILRDSIVTHYGEYLQHAKTVSEWSVKANTELASVNNNLDSLNKFAKNATADFQNIVEQINKVEDYSLASRVWIIFYADLQRMQRLMINYVQQNGIRSRILESMAILRSGILPMDFINQTSLRSLLNKVQEQLPANQQLLFKEDQLINYYNYPFSNLHMENGDKFIEIMVPIINRESITTAFQLNKVHYYPFRCWNNTACEENKSYQINNQHNVLFRRYDQILYSTRASELECIGQFERKVCFKVENEENMSLDECLESIYKKELPKCKFQQLSKPAKDLILNKDHVYQTHINHEGVLVGNTVFKNGTEVTGPSVIYDHVRLLKGNEFKLFANFDYTEVEEVKENRKQLKIMGNKLEDHFKFLQGRTLEQFIKETKIDSVGHQMQIENATSWVDQIIFLLPYLIGAVLLVINGNWRTIGFVTVIVKPSGSHAFDLLESAKKAYELNELKNRVVSNINLYFATVVFTIIALYLIYHTLFKLTIIEHYYGRVVNAREFGKDGLTAWHLVTTTNISTQHLFHNKEQTITIAYEIPHGTDCQLYTALASGIWLCENGTFTLSENLQVHDEYKLQATVYPDMTIQFRPNEISWNKNDYGLTLKPKIYSITSKRTFVHLAKLNEKSYSRFHPTRT
jgi:hypothetical protein